MRKKLTSVTTVIFGLIILFVLRIEPGRFIRFQRNLALAHEPIFGIGPQTLWKGGVGLELEMEKGRDKAKNGETSDLALVWEVAYGITSDLAVAIKIPFVWKEELVPGLAGGLSSTNSTGLGEVVLRLKYRFYRRDEVKRRDHLATVFGVKFPTGSSSQSPPLGSGSSDFLLGLTAARDARRIYLWGDLRYKIITQSSGKGRGNRMNYDTAVGLRPYLPEYLDPDLVLTAEINGEVIQGTGGHQISFSPGFLLAWRNSMVKGALRLPFYENGGTTKPGENYEFVLAVEVHL